MNEEKRQRKLLINYLLYFIAFSILCFLGVINVFGLTNLDASYKVFYYYNKNTYDSSVTGQVHYNDFFTTSNGYGVDLGQSSTYLNAMLMEFNGMSYSANNNVYLKVKGLYQNSGSCVNQLSDFSQIVSIYRINGSNVDWNTRFSASSVTPSVVSSSNDSQELTLIFTITPNTSGTGFRISWGDESSGRILGFKSCSRAVRFGITSIEYEITSDGTGAIIDQGQIHTQQNAEIIQGQQEIINNQNQNTQEIIDNQNDNTDRIIEENKKNFESCINNLNDKIHYGHFAVTTNGDFSTSDTNKNDSAYVDVSEYTGKYINIIYPTISSPARYNYCFISTDFENSSCISWNFSMSQTNYSNILIPNNAKYLILVGRPNPSSNILDWYKNISIEFTEPYCTNTLVEQEKTSKGILGKLGDLITGLFDTSGPDTDTLSGMAGWLPPGPVDSILNLPLTFLNNLTTSIGSSCSSLSVPLPFVTNTLSLPCFTTIISSINGASTLWTFIGTITTCLLLYYYLKSLYKWIDNKLALNEDTDWGGI